MVMCKEAKRYISHHKVKIGDKWMISVTRAREASEIAFEEGRLSAIKSGVKAGPNVQ